MTPSEQLLRLITEGFSADCLGRLESALAAFTPLSSNGRVAKYVARKVCVEILGKMEATQPISVTQHNTIERYVSTPLTSVVRALANNQDVSGEELASFIKASESARILV